MHKLQSMKPPRPHQMQLLNTQKSMHILTRQAASLIRKTFRSMILGLRCPWLKMWRRYLKEPWLNLTLPVRSPSPENMLVKLNLTGAGCCQTTRKTSNDVPHMKTEQKNPQSPRETPEKKQYTKKAGPVEWTKDNMPSTSTNSPNLKRKQMKDESGIARNAMLTWLLN